MVRGRAVAMGALSAGAAAGAAVGVIWGETVLARRAIGTSTARPPSADGSYGDEELPRTVKCALLGDSSLVGYGMERREDTPTALLGEGLSHVLDATVEMRNFAVVGATTPDLGKQLVGALEFLPDVAVISIGTNDVTHRVRPSESIHALTEVVRLLRQANVEVVVATCPDLSTVDPIPQPLRAIGGLLSRRLAERQTVAVVKAGGRTVSLGSLLAPIFRNKAELMFGADRFHPSASGYANFMGVLVPTVAAAVNDRWRGVRAVQIQHAGMPLAKAAAKAMREPGTEVAPIQRWAGVLKRRRLAPDKLRRRHPDKVTASKGD